MCVCVHVCARACVHACACMSFKLYAILHWPHGQATPVVSWEDFSPFLEGDAVMHQAFIIMAEDIPTELSTAQQHCKCSLVVLLLAQAKVEMDI